ncbi:MAG: hypothetical protein OS112_03250 [Methanoregula sp.]|nr:MAG: hypothetical protein OS112_03250 [Methanoregula sp.]
MEESSSTGSTDEISFLDVGSKDVPHVEDPNTKKLQAQVIHKIERQQVEEQVREDLGVDKTAIAPVPKEVPWLIFRFGAKTLQCEKFNLDDDEAAALAKHFTVLCEALKIKSWVWSAIIILLVIISKLAQCKDAILNFFKKKETTA